MQRSAALLACVFVTLAACGGGSGGRSDADKRAELLNRADAIVRSEGRVPNADTRNAALGLAKELCDDNEAKLRVFVVMRGRDPLGDAIFDTWCPNHRQRWEAAKSG